MTSKSEQLLAIKIQIALYDYDDAVKLDALLKRTLFLIKQFFGESSIYIGELKSLKFPDERNRDLSPGQYDHDLKVSLGKLENLLNIMIEDLNLSEKSKITKEEAGKTLPKSNRIFIVHGRDETMKQSVARTLEKLGLEPVILHEQPNQGRTLIEKFTDYSDVSFAIVLLSPDDWGHPKEVAVDKGKLRARQNAVFELGFFIGKLGRQNVMPIYRETSNFEMPSDYAGVVYTPFDVNEQWKIKLVQELRACHYNVDANRIL